eukprot:286735_1
MSTTPSPTTINSFITECSTSDVAASVIAVLVAVVFVITAIPMIHAFVQDYHTKTTATFNNRDQSALSVTESRSKHGRYGSYSKWARKGPPKPLFYSGFIFSIISFITLLLSIPYNFHCDEHLAFDILTNLFKVSYALHSYSLLLMWFLRLHFVFR